MTKGRKLEKLAVRFFHLIRWLENVIGPVAVCDYQDSLFKLYWKTTQEFYHRVPSPIQGAITLPFPNGLTWSVEDQQSFAQLWAEDEQEPLGHQLLREAKTIAEHNSRSALLICYSALEVGLKQHISKCAPDAAWLAMNAPTPPLYKMLRDYLPEIHSKTQAAENWDAIKPELKLINQFVEDRNKLAHRGEGIAGSLDDYLRITEDLLFAFDVLEGRSWAENHVSKKFGELLRWNSGKTAFGITLRLSQ